MIGKTEAFDVLIAGAGPAGTSAAIRLAGSGARVLLVEQKRFPRPKLCGEFISPECLAHFKQLGVSKRMSESGAIPVGETVFYSARGYPVAVPSRWFGASALGLSRAQMDNNLLQRAKEVGVTVLEETQATEVLFAGRRVRGLRLKSGTATADYQACVTIDATGRTRALARRVPSVVKTTKSRRLRPRLLAFKAHLSDACVPRQTCEIYFYPGGYGGINCVGENLSNLCFITLAKDVRRCGSDPEKVIREVVCKNSRAAKTLALARVQTDWLGVSLEGFGRQVVVPADGMLVAGDAAAFIDPFTGSGILMALETGQLAAETIIDHLPTLRSNGDFELLAKQYRVAYTRRFRTRLRVCSFLRTAAFVPRFAGAAILFSSASEQLRKRLATATRSGR